MAVLGLFPLAITSSSLKGLGCGHSHHHHHHHRHHHHHHHPTLTISAERKHYSALPTTSHTGSCQAKQQNPALAKSRTNVCCSQPPTILTLPRVISPPPNPQTAKSEQGNSRPHLKTPAEVTQSHDGSISVTPKSNLCNRCPK